MRVILLLIFIINVIYADSQQSVMDENDIVTTTQDKNVKTKISTFFNTAKVYTHSYGAFMVGYSTLNKTFNSKREQKQGIYFELDKGILFADDIILFGFSLDGVAGGYYSININTKLGARIFDGRIIPSISLGYGLLNHSMGSNINEKQYNLHGTISTISMFLDIASGFGMELGYRIGMHPFRTTKKSNIKVKNIGALMVNFKFMDFNI